MDITHKHMVIISSLGFDVNDVCKSFALLSKLPNSISQKCSNFFFRVCVFYYNTVLYMFIFIVFTG